MGKILTDFLNLTEFGNVEKPLRPDNTLYKKFVEYREKRYSDSDNPKETPATYMQSL